MIETTPAGARTFEYEYNDAGQLESVTKDGSVLASYTYDDNGNRLTATTGSGPSAETTTSTYNARDQLIQSGSLYFDYNENGELTSKTDDDTADHTTYSYSASGDLTGAELPDGKEITYILDPLGRRVGKKVDGNLVQGFLYAPGIQGPVAELDGAGGVRQTFIYATRSNVPDLIRRGGNTYKVITDHLGSPRMIVNSATGDVAQQITYDAFGKVTEDTSPGFTPFGFAGGLYDNDTGLTHFGAREYSAETGRWTAADPISFAGGDSNLYGYVMSDPVNLVDPSGLWFWDSRLVRAYSGWANRHERFSYLSNYSAGALNGLGFNVPNLVAGVSGKCAGPGYGFGGTVGTIAAFAYGAGELQAGYRALGKADEALGWARALAPSRGAEMSGAADAARAALKRSALKCGGAETGGTAIGRENDTAFSACC